MAYYEAGASKCKNNNETIINIELTRHATKIMRPILNKFLEQINQQFLLACESHGSYRRPP